MKRKTLLVADLFAGTKSDTTAMIGNAVNVDMAEALVRAALHDLTTIAEEAA